MGNKKHLRIDNCFIQSIFNLTEITTDSNTGDVINCLTLTTSTRVILEKLIVPQAVNEFLVFYGIPGLTNLSI
jgi:hypothetical protein